MSFSKILMLKFRHSYPELQDAIPIAPNKKQIYNSVYIKLEKDL